MKDNYPILMQSEERNAPWNQEELPPIKVDCCVSYCISKTMPVKVCSYKVDDGEINLEDTNLREEFVNNETLDIPALLCELKHLAEKRIKRLKYELRLSNPNHRKTIDNIRREIYYYESIISASKGWTIDDFDVIKE